jgi:signal transduction histidine kinase
MNEIELMEILEELLSTLRHELGNSINSLKITLDVLRENYDLFDDRKRKNYLERGLGLIARQQRLTDAMKAYARFNVKTQEEILVGPFLRSFLDRVSEKIKNENIKLNYLFEVKPCRIIGDSNALLKIMESIFDNAVEALEKVRAPEIEVQAETADDKVVILTKDNGSGISKKDLPKIFTPLFTTKPGKMGIGLPIARKLLWGMGGWIRVESTSGAGTEVRVCLDTFTGQKADTKRIQSPHHA